MSIRNLLVPLAGVEHDQTALETALRVARIFNGHLDVLHVRPDPMRQLPIADETMVPDQLKSLENIQKRIADEEQAARAQFDSCLTAHGVHICQDPPAAALPSASWYDATGIEAPEVARMAGAYDLIVIDLALAKSRNDSRETLEEVLFSTGRPVLLAPSPVRTTIGNTILLGWNRTAQSARAVQSAMPILDRAKRVIVCMVATGAKQGPPPQDIARTLAWHDIQTEVKEITPDGRSVGRILLDEARKADADLLAMGAYSHSRWREKILGGVTKYVIENAEIPVFLAH